MIQVLKLDMLSYMPLVRNYYLIHLINLIFFQYILKILSKFQVFGLYVTFIFFLSVMVLMGHNNVARNIRLLRNTFVSKIDLVRFYFLSRSIRFLITLFPYCLYYFKSSEDLNEIGNDFELLVMHALDSHIFLMIFLMSSFFTFIYAVPLMHDPDTSKNNLNYSDRKNIKNKKDFKKSFVAGLIVIFLINALKFIPDSGFLFLMVAQIFIVFIWKFNFQKLFLIFSNKSNNKVNLSILLVMVFYTCFSFYVGNQIVRGETDIKSAKDMYLSLGDLSVSISNDRLDDFINSTELFDEKVELLKYYGYEKIGIDVFVKRYILYYSSEKTVKSNGSNFNPFEDIDFEVEEDELKSIILNLSDYAGKRRFKEDLISSFHEILEKQKDFKDKVFLENLVIKNTIFTDYCAAELLFHHFDKDFQEEFLIKHHKQIRFEMVKTGFGSLDKIPKAYLELINEKTED